MAGLIPLPIVEDGVVITPTSGSDAVAWQAPGMRATVPIRLQDRDGPDRAEATGLVALPDVTHQGLGPIPDAYL